MRHFLALLVAGCLLFALVARAQPAEHAEPRVLIAFFDSREESTPRTSQIHRFLEMPANFLGYDIHYYDINDPLPPLGDDVAGVVLWFNIGVEVPDAVSYLNWLEKAVGSGKKLIIIENAGLGDSYRKKPDVMEQWNRVLAHIGLQDDSAWNDVTYHGEITHLNKEMVGFERAIGPVLPPLAGTHAIAGKSTSYLQVRLQDGGQDDSYDLVTTSPNGGYIAQGYALFHLEDKEHSDVSQWYINPFLFLKRALDMQLAPIPDPTTLDGRRIFYAHIDGDGWNNVSEIRKYDAKNIISAEVIYDEILKPYSDFAFNVGLITGDVDPDCYGMADSERVAREIFALPNVEASSHTHTHPLFWQFFMHYRPSQEKPLLGRYPPKPKENYSLPQTIKDVAHKNEWSGTDDKASPEPEVKRGRNEESVNEVLKKYFYVPRSYACKPFDLDREIKGSIDRINQLVPPGRNVKLIQWSGDTSPFEAALRKSREAGVLNINGGDSRFDKEYPSYSSVAPVGLRVGKELQIYSSNSNEDTYTNLWTDRFFGFRYLQTTVENTEKPIRVRPFNIYFHVFSGQKEASLNAIKHNLEYARTRPIIPITASDYAAIAQGFYSTSITPDGPLRWKITGRGALETMRFDKADEYVVDMASSSGVMGFRHYQGSLYVALDPSQPASAIQLTKRDKGQKIIDESLFLIESRWKIKGLQLINKTLTFQAQGYGQGTMSWKVSPKAQYRVTATRDGKSLFDASFSADDKGILSLNLVDTDAIDPVKVTLEQTH